MKRLLIIEDDRDFADIIEMALLNRFLVKVKNDTENLLEVLDDFKPDVLLIDNYVGQKKAIEIISEIRDKDTYANLPLILYSAHPNVEHIANELRANGWLLKPFKLTDLYATIEKVLNEVA